VGPGGEKQKGFAGTGPKTPPKDQSQAVRSVERTKSKPVSYDQWFPDARISWGLKAKLLKFMIQD